MPDQTPAKQLTKSRYGFPVGCCNFAARVAAQASMSSQSCRFAAAIASASRLRSTRPWLLYVVVFQMQRPPCRCSNVGQVCDACGNQRKPTAVHQPSRSFACQMHGKPSLPGTGRASIASLPVGPQPPAGHEDAFIRCRGPVWLPVRKAPQPRVEHQRVGLQPPDHLHSDMEPGHRLVVHRSLCISDSTLRRTAHHQRI